MGVLSIAKLRVGQEAYHLSGVAQSLGDYYSGAGEAHGQWIGGAARLGLDGQVDPDDLRAVLAGLRPGTGGLTPNGDTLRPHPRRVPGFDLTFKAPKSASVLYAVSDDPRVPGAVVEAGEAAMSVAIGYLEREAVRVQRGSHNLAYLARLDEHDRKVAGPRRLDTSGVVAASFRHRTSRAGDPLLHWHVLVANVVEGTDGKWSSLVHPEIYRHARAAGEVFQAVYRDELTRRLGVEWRPGVHVPEIAGVPQHVLDAFSKRTQLVEAWLEATGTPNTIAGRQAAVLATRRNKPEREPECFDAVWKLEAEALGWGPAHAEGLVVASMRRNPIEVEDVWRLETVGLDEHGNVDTWERTVTPDEWITDLLRRDLTADRTTFTQPELTTAIAKRLGHGASIDTIERLTRHVFASTHTITVEQPGHRPPTWTTGEILQVEQGFIGSLTHTTALVIDHAAVASVLDTRSDLGDDQHNAVQQLCTSTAGVAVLVGPAGTGKTYTIDTIRTVFETNGIPVTGVAPSARAAHELAGATGMATTTMHRHLLHANTAPAGLLVIDEAGMADIRTLTHTITTHLDRGGRVLLAGDHHQLPEIGAGGGFHYAAHHATTIAELTVNRRQHNDWERAALTELRDGNVHSAVASYFDHERVQIAPTPGDLIEQAITLWADARADGLNPVLLAGTNELVDHLNHAAINHLITTGQLDNTDQTTYGNTPLRLGERVVLRRNNHDGDDHTSIANGHTGTITTIAAEAVTVTLDHGPTVTLDEHYLRHGGHVTHAYALTSHRAQGGTWDHAIAVGADTLHREAAYVQLSRGTHANHIVLTDPEATELLNSAARDTARHDHGITHPDDEPDPAQDHLTQRHSRSAAKHLAHTLDPDLGTIDQLTRTHTYPDLIALAQHATYAEHLTTTTHGHHRDHLIERLERLEFVAQHIAIGQQVSAADRNNIGIVTAIDDTHGTATIHFTAHTGGEAERQFGWGDLRIVEPRQPEPRNLDDTATHNIDQHITAARGAVADWDRTLLAHDTRPGDAHTYRATAQHILEQAANRLAAENPIWFRVHLGVRPHDVAGSRTWDNATTTIAKWSLTHPAGSNADGAGLHQLRTWTQQTRTWLDNTGRNETAPAVQRDDTQLSERHGELVDILATAPDDVRTFITDLRNQHLGGEQINDQLITALDQNTERRRWILEHWPHIVEYAEIDRAIAMSTIAAIDPITIEQWLARPCIPSSQPSFDGTSRRSDELGALCRLSALSTKRSDRKLHCLAPRLADFDDRGAINSRLPIDSARKPFEDSPLERDLAIIGRLEPIGLTKCDARN